MGVTKTENFTAIQNRIAALAKAIGHPARVAILQEIINKQSCVCGDLVTELPLAQATISQHLKALKEVGFIQGEIEGTSVCYCINESLWEEVKTIFDGFFNAFNANGKCC